MDDETYNKLWNERTLAMGLFLFRAQERLGMLRQMFRLQGRDQSDTRLALINDHITAALSVTRDLHILEDGQ